MTQQFGPNGPVQNFRNKSTPAPQSHPMVAANNRQFGGAGQAIKGAVGKLRVAKRLGGLLRRGR